MPSRRLSGLNAGERDRFVRDLGEGDLAQRVFAAFALREAVDDGPAIAALMTALADPDSAVRDLSAASLGILESTEAIPQILELLRATPPREAWGAAYAVARLYRVASAADKVSLARALWQYRARSGGRARGHAEALLDGIGTRP